MAKKAIPVLVWKEGKLYIAKTLSLELASQGKTKKEALSNLQEALDLKRLISLGIIRKKGKGKATYYVLK